MVEIDSQTRIADALHHFAVVTVEAFFADVLVIKRRQHQHTGATVFSRMRGEFDCSESEQQPVPGIMRDGSMPAAISALSKEMRSYVDIEFASLVVPNGASRSSATVTIGNA